MALVWNNNIIYKEGNCFISKVFNSKRVRSILFFLVIKPCQSHTFPPQNKTTNRWQKQIDVVLTILSKLVFDCYHWSKNMVLCEDITLKKTRYPNNLFPHFVLLPNKYYVLLNCVILLQYVSIHLCLLVLSTCLPKLMIFWSELLLASSYMFCPHPL